MIKSFFKQMRDVPTLNLVAVFLFILINFANSYIFSFSKSCKYDNLANYVSELVRTTDSKSLNLSMTSKTEISTDTFKELADYSYFQTYYKIDINLYDIRLTFNTNPNGMTVDYSGTLGNKKVGLVCKNMDFVEIVNDSNTLYKSMQVGVNFEFPRKGSTTCDFKDKATNFIYIRSSDADKLISMQGSIYYGLTHEELLGKPIDVKLAYGDLVIEDKWKIDNIILEEINGKTDKKHQHLLDLYGDYYLSSMYALPLFQGCSVDFELAESAASNVRNMKKALNKFSQKNFSYSFYNVEINDSKKIPVANSMLTKLLNTKDNDLTITLICVGYSAAYLVGTYFMFSKSKKYRIHNIMFYILSFFFTYTFVFIINSISTAKYGSLFSSYSIIANFFLLVTSIIVMLVSSIEENKVDKQSKEKIAEAENE